MSFFTKSLIKVFQNNGFYSQNLRNYARWSHRRPRRVLNEEGESFQPTDAAQSENLPSQTQPRWLPKNVEPSLEPKLAPRPSQHGKTPKYATQNKVKSTDMLETVIDANGDLVFTKLKDNDSTVSQLLLMVKSRREQIKKDLALLEGKRLIREALEANCNLKSLLFSRKSDVEFLKPFLPKTGAKLLKIPYREIQLWSDLSTSPGVMGIFRTPNVSKYIPKESFPITVVCDNIREPGNLGAILRTVAGVGVEKVFLTNGCVDLWDTKVLRSACGAHFRLQIHKKVDWTQISDEVVRAQSAVFLADNNIISESEFDNSNEKEMQSLEEIVGQTQLVPYYSIDFANFRSITLVVGGETCGLSEMSFRLADSVKGVRLHIPLSNAIDSLNAGTALGIILFEIKKQLLLAKVTQREMKL